MRIKFSFMVLFLASSPAFASFTKAPYLQPGSSAGDPDLSTSITVCWETLEPAAGEVHYGTQTLDMTAIDSNVSTRHEVELSGLEPDTRYYYRVVSGDDVSGVSDFRTAPLDPQTPFSFAVIGDTRTNLTDHAMVVDMMMSWEFDLYLHSGDMVEWGNSLAAWKDFFDIESPLMQSSLLLPTIGNHELYGEGTTPVHYLDYFALPLNLSAAEEYYSCDYGSVHFLVLDTESLDMASQLDAISSDLAAASAGYPNPRFIVVLMHRPAYSNSNHGGDENYPYSSTWGPLFEEARVALVVEGHDHCYERFEPIDSRAGLGEPDGEQDVIREGVTYLTGGGGGAPLRDVEAPPGSGGQGTPPLDSLVAEKTYEAGLIEVSGGLMQATFYRALDGSTLDSFTIIRNERPEADAGPPAAGLALWGITLDGSASTDLENDPLSYQWRQVEGPDVEIEDLQSPVISFVPVMPGRYIFELVVSDGIDLSEPDYATAYVIWPGSEDGDDDNNFPCGGISGGKNHAAGPLAMVFLLIPAIALIAARIIKAKREKNRNIFTRI